MLNFWPLKLALSSWGKDCTHPRPAWSNAGVAALEEALVAVETMAMANWRQVDVVETVVLVQTSATVDSDTTSPTTTMTIVHHARSAIRQGTLLTIASTGSKKHMNQNRNKLLWPPCHTTSTQTATLTLELLTTSR
jgi:hypothetical protein